MLQSKSLFYCSGDDCDYIFDLGRRSTISASALPN